MPSVFIWFVLLSHRVLVPAQAQTMNGSSFSCTGYQECKNLKMQCNDAQDCLVVCAGNNACDSANITAPSNANLFVECSSYQSCIYAYIYGPSIGNLIVNCTSDDQSTCVRLEIHVPCPRSTTSEFSIACFERILCILSMYFLVKYISKQGTIMACLLCVVHVTNATTCSVTLSSHYYWTGPSSYISSLNGEWTATGIQDAETYYVKDTDYLYFLSLNVRWYIGPTLGSTTVLRYCVGTDLFTCPWYDWDPSVSQWVLDSTATVSTPTCFQDSTTCSVTLSSHYYWTGPSSYISSLNGEWTATGIQDAETYYVKDTDYLYFLSLNVRWYIGPTLGSTTVLRYCVGTDLFTCPWYDWDPSVSQWVLDSTATVSTSTCVQVRLQDPYIFVNVLKTWDEAEDYCQSMYDSHLATIEDDLSAQALLDGCSFCTDDFLWMGLNDQAVEGTWEYADGTACPGCATSPYWNDGEPNNSGDEDCAEVYLRSTIYNMLNDGICTNDQAFACNKPTAYPIAYPTAYPTAHPSTAHPTAHPTVHPTTTRPTIHPTVHPTVHPATVHPTSHPTTASPTVHPSVSPTTTQPTIQPSTHPTTANPTAHPITAHPTLNPTIPPTVHPTVSTVHPTNQPTFAPITAYPTVHPTTVHPTVNPSIHPTTTHPTIHPTMAPTTAYPTTAYPTLNPTISLTSVKPTVNPTIAPTSANPTVYIRECFEDLGRGRRLLSKHVRQPLSHH
eukprot:14199_1